MWLIFRVRLVLIDLVFQCELLTTIVHIITNNPFKSQESDRGLFRQFNIVRVQEVYCGVCLDQS